MKRFITLLIIGMLIHHSSNASQHGSLIGEAFETNDIFRYRLQFVTDRVVYTTTGITVNYPITFTNAPMVSVSIDLSAGTLLPNTTYTAIITSNTASSVTITVLTIFDDGTSTTITDTLTTDNVIVNILAIG